MLVSEKKVESWAHPSPEVFWAHACAHLGSAQHSGNISAGCLSRFSASSTGHCPPPPPRAIAAPAPSATPPTDAGDGRVGEMKAKDGEEEGRGESSHDDDDL